MLGRGLCARPMLPQRTVGQAPSAWRSISISATSDSSLSTDASATNASIHGSVPELVATDGGMHATTYANEIAQVAADATAAVGGAAVAEALPAVEIVTEAIPYFRPYSPATIMCNTLEAVHTTTGLPWWATVAACTLTARACLLPVIVYTMKNGAKMALMKPEMDAVQARFKAEQRTDPTAQARFQRDAQALMTKYDVHPARMLIGPLSQAPIFISFFMATRRLAEYNPEVAEEAFLWVPSIAEADPLFVLPVCASITMLTIAQLGGDTGNDAQKEQMEKFRKVMSIAAIGVFPLTYWMPSLTFCYWISSNSFSCFQVPLMRQPAVKRAFGIPIVPTAAAGTIHRTSSRAWRRVVLCMSFISIVFESATPSL